MTQATIEIKSAAPIDGKHGPQWQLEVKWPWSDYPTKTWVEQADFRESPAPGTYQAVVEKTNQKPKTDGTKQYHWNYRILELGPLGAAPVQQSAPSNGNQQQGDRYQYQRSKEEMRWTEAMHLATRTMGIHPSNLEEEGEFSDDLLGWAFWFFDKLGVPPDTQQQLQEPVSGASEQEGPLFPEEPHTPGAMCPDHPNSRVSVDGNHPIWDDAPDGGRIIVDWCPPGSGPKE